MNSNHIQSKSREVTLKLTITKKGFIFVSTAIILIMVSIYLYSAGFINQWYAAYQQASAVVTVKNSETQEPISGAIVKIGQSMSSTNQSGEAQLTDLIAGQRTIQITQAGFNKYDKTIYLTKGNNRLPEARMIVSPLEKIIIKSLIKDKISNLPIGQANIALDTKSTQSDDQGVFQFTNITSGKYLITIQKEGYKNFSQEVTLDRQSVKNDYYLTPDRKIFFMSNRDGKNGIYTTDLEAESPSRIVPKSDKGEEWSLNISPDYQYAYFDSYREGVKDENNNKVLLGYILDLKTNKFNQISLDRFPSQIKWSPDNKYLIYQTTKAVAGQQNQVLNSYNISKAENKILWQGSGNINSISFAGESNILATINKYYQDDPSTLDGFILYNLENQKGKQVLMDKPYGFQEDVRNNKIYFQVSRDNLKYEYDTEKLEIIEIKEIPDDFNNYIFSPDGRKMVYAEIRDGKTDIYLKYPNNDETKKLTTSGTASAPVWLDNELILYSENRPGETAIYTISSLGGQGLKITDVTISSSYSGYY